MKMVHALLLKPSLQITNEVALAIDILSMNSQEIDELIDKELLENHCLLENLSQGEQRVSSFDIALDQRPNQIDFRQHLMEQVNLGAFNVVEKNIALELIYNLNDDGLLMEAQEIYLAIAHTTGIYPEWIESVRLRLMSLDPPGCAAISINEALRYQVGALDKAHALLQVLNKIGANPNYKISKQELNNIYGHDNPHLGRLLNPRPARAFQTLKYDSDEPDLVLVKNSDNFTVSLIKKSSERLVFDRSIVANSFSVPKDVKIFKANSHRARFLLKSLRYREQNLVKVASAVVEYQRAWFFESGELKPLRLSDIAQKTGLHESTVSRLVKNKGLASERGVHELKYFFSQRASNNTAQQKSSLSVKDLIKVLIAQENKARPFSDALLCRELRAQKVEIARRTVAKYREAMGILPAHERRIFSASS